MMMTGGPVVNPVHHRLLIQWHPWRVAVTARTTLAIRTAYTQKTDTHSAKVVTKQIKVLLVVAWVTIRPLGHFLAVNRRVCTVTIFIVRIGTTSAMGWVDIEAKEGHVEVMSTALIVQRR